MEKEILNSVFQKLKGGCFAVQYWDDKEVVFGQGQPDFQCSFSGKPSLTAMAADPILAIGEMYMAGVVDFKGNLEAMFQLVHRNPPEAGLGGRVLSAAGKGLGLLKNSARQKENIKAHYDLGNDFFSLWLDETMSYSCAYFKSENDSLKQAQLQKIDLILKKMRLQPGQKILDIGCGWGWLILRAAEQYGVKALGITLSEEQYAQTRQRIAQAGREGEVEVRLLNYLNLSEAEESFDRVISVGMFEHVGQACFRDYFQKVAALLKPGGLTMLHSLTCLTEKETNAWVKKCFKQAVYEYSGRQMIEELFKESTLFLTSLAPEKDQDHLCRFDKLLGLIKCNILTPEEIERINEDFIYLVSEEASNHPFCDLYRLGLLGIVEPNQLKGRQRFQTSFGLGITGRRSTNILPEAEFYVLHLCLTYRIKELYGRSYKPLFGIRTGEGIEIDELGMNLIRLQKGLGKLIENEEAGKNTILELMATLEDLFIAYADKKQSREESRILRKCDKILGLWESLLENDYENRHPNAVHINEIYFTVVDILMSSRANRCDFGFQQKIAN